MILIPKEEFINSLSQPKIHQTISFSTRFMNDSVTNTKQEIINDIENGEFIPFENQEERKNI